MQIGELLKNKKFEKTEVKITEWQDYALQVIDMFKLEKKYRAMIFRHAKNNKSYLQGKVSFCKDKFGENLEGKGHYFISLFRKKKPWDK